MNGFCDVHGCIGETYMGQRPLTESHGKQICEGHWNRHKDKLDDFSLFDVFGFKSPTEIPTRPVIPELSRSVPVRALVREWQCRACGAERERGHTYCLDCGRERRKRCDRERQRRRYQKRQNSHAFV